MAPFDSYKSSTTLSGWMKMLFSIPSQMNEPPPWQGQLIIHFTLEHQRLLQKPIDSSWDKLLHGDRSYFPFARDFSTEKVISSALHKDFHTAKESTPPLLQDYSTETKATSTRHTDFIKKARLSTPTDNCTKTSLEDNYHPFKETPISPTAPKTSM